MQRFNFITFNIHSDADLFVDMAKYVSKKNRTIVAIQEKPKKKVIEQIEKMNDVSLITDLNNRLAFIIPKSLNIISRKNAKKDMPNLLERRTLEMDLPLQDGVVKIVNVHGFSKKDNGDEKNKDLFSRINETYENCPKKIVLGDFNTNPYELNMTLESRIYADRDFESVVNSKKDVLYNPSWRYLRERKKFKGTHYYESCIPRWHFYDQILISKSLVGLVTGTGASRMYTNYVKLFHIVDRLGNRVFKPSESYDKDKHISDHMPVLLTLEM